MTCTEAANLFAYTEWADDRILKCVERLGETAWTQSLGGGFPTLIETLSHLVLTEWSWGQRWMGTLPTKRPSWADAPTPSTLRAELAAVEADRRAFLEGIVDEDLRQPLTYTLLSGETGAQPFQDLLLHVVNHSTYHRGQAASMIRRLGHAPPATDYLVYAASANGLTTPR